MTNNRLTENSVNQLLNSVRLARDNAERDDNRVDHSFYFALTIALEELQERRKADSEPVALQPELEKVIYHFRDWNEGFPVERFKADYVISWMLANYPPAQPAPIVQPVMFIDGDILTEDADKLAKVIREFNEEDERPLAKMARIIRENPHPTNECDMPKVQKKPVVPEEAYSDDCPELYPSQPDAWADGWNACRAAMLNRK